MGIFDELYFVIGPARKKKLDESLFDDNFIVPRKRPPGKNLIIHKRRPIMADNNAAACKVVTGKVRFSYCNIFKARAFQEGDQEKFSLCILIPKKDKVTLKKIRAAIEAATEIGKASKWGGKVPKKFWNPLRDGDEERADEAEEYAGCYFLQAKSNSKPGIVDDQLNEILDPTEVYSGCYGRVSINFFPYNTNSNGIGVGLNNVQKLADGEPLGGARASAEDDFADSRPDLADDDDDLGLD